jgi:hypothetical protein
VTKRKTFEFASYKASLSTIVHFFCITLTLATKLAEGQQQSVIVIDNSQQVSSTVINDKVDENRKEYWTERLGYKIVKNNDYPLYLVLKATAQALAGDPSLERQTLTNIARDSYSALTEAPSSNVQGPGASGAAISSLISMQNPYIGAAAPVLNEMMVSALKLQLDSLYSNDPDAIRSKFLDDGPDGLRRLWVAAKNDPKLQAVFDDLTIRKYGLKLGDLPGINADPEFDQHTAALKTLENTEQFGTFFKESRDQLNQLVKQLKQQRMQQLSREGKQQQVDAFKAGIANQRAELYLASTALGFVDPKLGRTIGGVGEAYIKISESIGLHNLGQMSSVVVTANFLSAGLMLSSLMNSAPTADQLILDQLAQISRQIDSFRVEMHKRFDRVDEELNRVYVDMVANFTEVNRNVSKARQGIISLQTRLYTIQDKLNEINRRTQSYAQSLSKQMSDASLSYCLGTVDYVPGFVLSEQDYAKCAVAFTRAATVVAKLDVWANHAVNLTDDAIFTDELKRPLEENLNFLWEVSSAKFGQRPVPFVMLANPAVWAANSNAYIQLVSRARPILDSEKATGELIQVGKELHDFVQLLAQKSSGKAGTNITARLLARYLSNWRQLELATTRFEAAYRNTVTRGYDPWAGADQGKDSSTPESWTFTTAPGGAPIDLIPASMPACDGDPSLSGVALSTPPGLARKVPNSFRISSELGLGSLAVCYRDPAWVQQSQRLGHEDWKEFRGKLAVRIRISLIPNPPATKATSPMTEDRAIKPASPDGSATSMLLVANLYGAGGLEYLVQCGALNSKGALNTAILRQGCEKKRQNGLTTEDLKDGFATIWQSDEGLRSKFATVATEQESSESLNANLKSSRSLVESCFATHRRNLRLEVSTILLGGTGDFGQKAEEKMPMLEALRNIEGLKALLDAYVGLLLSESSRSSDTIAMALGDLTTSHWASRLDAIKDLRGFSKAPSNQISRVLTPIGVPQTVGSLRKFLEIQLSEGPQPIASIESTLTALESLRKLQIVTRVSKAHQCFSDVVEGSVSSADSATSPRLKDETIISSLRFDLNATSTAAVPTIINVLLGDRTRLLSELVGTTTTTKEHVSFEVPLPPRLTFKQFRSGIIRICEEYGSSLDHPVSQALTLSMILEGQSPTEYRTWNNITWPAARKVAVTLQESSEKTAR